MFGEDCDDELRMRVCILQRSIVGLASVGVCLSRDTGFSFSVV